jgi:hypothetical protein
MVATGYHALFARLYFNDVMFSRDLVEMSLKAIHI